jgi:hypothetical protein
VTDLKESPMTATPKRERTDEDLAQILNTRPPTERAFRRRSSLVNAELSATAQQDEVLMALVILADRHPEELVDIVRTRRIRA